MVPFKKDDDTVDSDSFDPSPLPEAKQPTLSIKKRNARLTKVSKAYDLDGDGQLDKAEQAMRDRDISNRGFLTNDEIYDIVQEQLQAQRSAGYMKGLIAGLTCFVVLLALSNLGTSLAAAVLAKDLSADDGVMRIAGTGAIAAAQSTADAYDAREMTDEELEGRRLLVLGEMDEDPHSHAHRRLKKKNCKQDDIMEACGGHKISFDSRSFGEDEFYEIQTKCERQQNVYMRRSWGDDTRNECICSRGTSVVVKEKRSGGGGKKNKNNNKNKNDNKKNNKNKNKNKNKHDKNDAKKGRNIDREVIIETANGRILHADCVNGRCYTGGDALQGELGDSCLLNADECGDDLVCRRVSTNNNSVRNGRGGGAHGRCAFVTIEMTDIVRERNVGGGTCDAGRGVNACDGDFYCKPNSSNPIRGRNANGGNGAAGMAYQGAVISGPSGTVATGNMNGGGAGINARSAGDVGVYRGLGRCVRTVGFGQTCYNDLDCGRGNSCDGLGENTDTDGLIVGPSGTIAYGNGIGATQGICN